MNQHRTAYLFITLAMVSPFALLLLVTPKARLGAALLLTTTPAALVAGVAATRHNLPA